MKVFYDLIYLEKEKHGGISRMWIEYFKKVCSHKLDVIYMGKLDADNTTMSYLRDSNFCNNLTLRESSKLGGVLAKVGRLNIFRNIALLKKIPDNITIFHSTGYANPLFKIKDVRIITTIHDMVFWDQKDKMKKGVSYWDNVWGIYHSLRVSDRIIAVSNASKYSIIEHFPWAKEKIDVIYHGLPEDFLKVEINLKKEKYFMFIGGRNEYKNYDLLLKSFALFVKDSPEWKLCVVGQNDHTVELENERYKELGISGNVNDYGLVDQDVMIGLLQNAAAVVIPSLNEGFNFPLLEAMACGSPVLSSDIPVSKEIGKSYVSYFDNDTESLLHCMLSIKNNGVEQGKLVNARNYAHTFNWDNSYKKLLAVYNSCI